MNRKSRKIGSIKIEKLNEAPRINSELKMQIEEHPTEFGYNINIELWYLLAILRPYRENG